MNTLNLRRRFLMILPAVLAVFLVACGGGGGGSGSSSGAPPSTSSFESGVVTTVAGQATVPGSTDATSTAATFHTPSGVATDGINLYVADSENDIIRKIVVATGVVTTLAGKAMFVGSTDGTGAAARFGFPVGITTDGTNLYVADSDYSTIRKIVVATGVVTTLAGVPQNPVIGCTGSADGTGAAAGFCFPQGITTDGTNLYVADTGNDTIRKIVIATGAVTTLAGHATVPGFADGTGAAATFNQPQGLATDGVNVYVADTFNETIRKIVIATGAVTTLAGQATVPGFADGTGAAATFFAPSGITTDDTNLYVGDYGNDIIRKISIATGAVTTLAGQATVPGFTDGTGAAATFSYPYGVAIDGTDLYVADSHNDTIRKIH